MKLNSETWTAGPFGHHYRLTVTGLIEACPSNVDGTPDAWEETICLVADWQDGQKEVAEWLKQ